jgi:arylsulfatase A-like enzyme
MKSFIICALRMVSAMDKSIGLLLNAVEQLGLDESTLIVFTSDNGPEMQTGNPGPFRGRKRSFLVCLITPFVLILQSPLSHRREVYVCQQ